MATPWLPTFSNRRQDPQTIHSPFMAYVRAEGVNLAADATTVDLSAELTTALAAAARNNQPVPYQDSTDMETRGLVTTAPNNRVEIYSTASTDKLKSDSGEEVYGRLGAAGVVTLKTIDNTGAEADYTLPAGDYSYEVAYLFDFHELPTNALIALTSRNVSQDAGGGGGIVQEELTLTADNTIPDVTGPIVAGSAGWLDYRGFTLTINAASSVVSIDPATNAVTFDSAAAGFTIPSGEMVTVYYSKP